MRYFVLFILYFFVILSLDSIPSFSSAGCCLLFHDFGNFSLSLSLFYLHIDTCLPSPYIPVYLYLSLLNTQTDRQTYTALFHLCHTLSPQVHKCNTSGDFFSERTTEDRWHSNNKTIVSLIYSLFNFPHRKLLKIWTHSCLVLILFRFFLSVLISFMWLLLFFMLWLYARCCFVDTDDAWTQMFWFKSNLCQFFRLYCGFNL